MNTIASTLSKQSGIRPELLDEAVALTPDAVTNWLHTIDESAYTVEEWAESIIAFDQWAMGEKRTLVLPHMLEYLSCCTESTRSGVKLPLSFLLQQFLKTNGVE